jgi:hypothetical protein
VEEESLVVGCFAGGMTEKGEEEEACEMGEGRVAAIGANFHQSWATIFHPC